VLVKPEVISAEREAYNHWCLSDWPKFIASFLSVASASPTIFRLPISIGTAGLRLVVSKSITSVESLVKVVKSPVSETTILLLPETVVIWARLRAPTWSSTYFLVAPS